MVGNLRELIPAFFVGPNGEQLSADEIARRRDVAASLLAQATDTSPTAGGGASVLAKAIQGLSYGINEGRARRASQANAEASQANIAAMLGGSGSAPSASAFPPTPSAGDVAALTGGAPDVASARVAQAHGDSAATGGEPTVDLMTSYIREAAARRGVDPDIAVRVARSEGLAPGVWQSNVINKRGQRETSYGPFQLLVGGGLGDKFQKLYGASPADKSTWRQQIDFALDEAATGGWSPWYGAAKVGVGRRTGLDNARALGYQPSAVAASPAVAANEAMATGQMQGGLTPAALNSWAEQNYAPGAIDRSVLAPVAAPASDVLVAESPEDIAAAELAMNDPAFAGPAVAEIAPTVAPAPAPMPSPQVAQALTAMPVNDALPMAGSVDNPRPIVPAAPQNPMQGLNPAVVQALSNPNATAQERSVAQALLQQHVAQNQALQEQARKQAEQANMLAQRRGLAGRMGIDPNYAVDDTIWKAATEANFRDPASYSAGSYIRNSDGTLEQVPLNPTGDIQNYEYYARKEIEAGRVPLSPLEYEQALRRSGATSVTVGGDGAPGLGKLSTDYGYVLDPTTGLPVIDPATGLPRSAPIPGSPAAIAAEQAAAEQDRLAGAQTRSDADKAETTLDATGSVLDIMRDAETPATGTLSKPFALYSGTPAGKVRSYVKTLQSGAALGAMQRLKEMSATGATGFGALSAPELDLLINDIGALDPDSTEPEIFIKTVERIRDRSRRVAQDIAKNVSPERIQELGLQSFIDSFKASESKGNRTQYGVEWRVK